MKTLYLIGGPMGVGKTAVCQCLKARTDRCVFLDGDWCWDMHPLQVTEETKEMVTDNICHLLNHFIHCSAIDTIFFCWVMHQQEIIDNILARLDMTDCRAVPVSLICRADELRRRLEGDIRTGKWEQAVIERSLAYLPLYQGLDTTLVNTTVLTPQETAAELLEIKE